MTAPSLASRARAVCREAGLRPGQAVVLACSGGLDSQVLLDVMAHVARPRGRPTWFEVFAVGIDHGLRPEAQAELALVADLARARGVPFLTRSVSLGSGGNIQARARSARYAALRQVAREVGATFVATGHHLDDRAETVLLRIFRGAPLEGLAVLPSHHEDLLRPLIGARRVEIEAHARRRGIVWAEDPSNRNPRYLRVRVRTELLPLLRQLDARIDEHLVAIADQAQRCAVADDALRLSAVLRDLGGAENVSLSAVAALDRAVEGRRQRERIWLRGGRVARWDPQRGVVIASTCDEVPVPPTDAGPRSVVASTTTFAAAAEPVHACGTDGVSDDFASAPSRSRCIPMREPATSGSTSRAEGTDSVGQSMARPLK